MNDLNEISSSELNTAAHFEKITSEYPWCSLAQFNLLRYYKKNDSLQFEKQAEKTALYFTNLNWLNWQLHNMPVNEQISQPEPQKDPKNNTDSIIAFEPLHMTDYFASQGIKITEEPAGSDKLARQMKSFTEWLKTMKKVHQDNLPPGDEQTDKNIRQIAENSNAGPEVVTEAMAEVLVKQNKIDNAIAVYRKLSLINPSKSAYFAAKIDGLSAGQTG